MRLKETALIFLLKALGHLSLRQIYWLAKFIYILLWPFPLKFKLTIYINLSRCFPELSTSDLKKLVNETVFQTILRMLEMPFFWFAPLAKINRLKWEVIGEDGYKNAIDPHKGMITLVPHLGAWEAVNYYIGSHYSAVSLYKPSKKSYQEILVKIARERFNVQMHPTNVGGIKNLLQALKQGFCAGILFDHDPGENGGVYVPFFGISANTTTLIAKLAAKSQAPVYFAVAERLAKGRGFRLHFIKARDDISNADVDFATANLNAQTAEIIKLFPEQYEWSYKRFRRTRWGKVWFYETDAPLAHHAIGLVGGIASGKTTAANFFKARGITIIDTDALARELTNKDSPALAKIAAHFDQTVLDTQGELDRGALRQIIFQNPNERIWLENLLHPLIRERAQDQAMVATSPYSIVAVPLLKRREDYAFLEKIIFINTAKEIQIERLMARDHISREAAEAVIQAQPSADDFKKIADIVIDNNGTEAELIEKLKAVHERLIHTH